MLQLRADPALGQGDSLVLAPESGGAVIGWVDAQGALLRRALPGAVLHGDFHRVACFPLVPYCNRIAFGRFSWAGRDHTLAANFGDHPHTLHGVGWQRAWQVEQVSDRGATLSLQHDAQGDAARGWPFAFTATLSYAFEGTSLLVTLAATNRHAAPAPMGIGLHPYFSRQPGSSLRFAAQGVWQNDATALPSRHEPVPVDWNHAAGRPIGSVVLDNCFTGWDGRALLGIGTRRLALEASEAFRCLQVYTPVGTDFFCVEPVSHAPDAINRPDLPPDQAMRVLDPGDTLSGTIRLTHLG